MMLVVFLFVLLTPACASRIYRRGARFEEEAHRQDPLSCHSIIEAGKPITCSNAEQHQCPIECGLLEEGSAASDDASPRHKVIAAMDPLNFQQELRAASFHWHAFKSFWPQSCEGKSLTGEKLAIKMNGFPCYQPTPRANSIVGPSNWFETSKKCCAGSCVHDDQCGVEQLSLGKAMERASMGSTFLSLTPPETKHVPMKTILMNHREDVHSPIYSMTAVDLPAESVSFKNASDELEAGSASFFKEFVEALSTAMSLQVSGAQMSQGKKVHVQFCVHGSSMATKESVKPELKDLQRLRALRIGGVLKDMLDAPGGWKVADAFDHFKGENENESGVGLAGRQLMTILYKLYDASQEPPGCERQDLYHFWREKAPIMSGYDAQCPNPTDLPFEDDDMKLHPETTLESQPESIRAFPDLDGSYYMDGEKIHWSCPGGYRMVGARASVCEGGEWSSRQPRCEPIIPCRALCTCVHPKHRVSDNKGNNCAFGGCHAGLLWHKSQCVYPERFVAGTWKMNQESMSKYNLRFDFLEGKNFQLSIDDQTHGLDFRLLQEDPSKGLVPLMTSVRLQCHHGKVEKSILACVAEYQEDLEQMALLETSRHEVPSNTPHHKHPIPLPPKPHFHKHRRSLMLRLVQTKSGMLRILVTDESEGDSAHSVDRKLAIFDQME